MIKKSDEQYIYLSRIKYDVLKFISEFISKNSYSPTQLEISKKFRFSRARAGKIVSELKSLHLIDLGKSAQRKIRMSAAQINNINTLKFNKEYSLNEFH